MFFFSLRRTFLAPAAVRLVGGIQYLLKVTGLDEWEVRELPLVNDPVVEVPAAQGTRREGRGPVSDHLVFFLPATVRFGPLRVRALVLVRWPRTGRPMRWRRPW